MDSGYAGSIKRISRITKTLKFLKAYIGKKIIQTHGYAIVSPFKILPFLTGKCERGFS